MKFDVSIIGCGAAGLTASIFAAQNGAKTAVIEKNTVAGRKLLKTGRGRCNLTHTGTVEDFVRTYGFCGRFLKHSLYEFPPDTVRQFFSERHLATKVEKDGCVFPITDRATDVCRILVDSARRGGVAFFQGRCVESVQKQSDDLFLLSCGKDRFESPAVIIATGGKSWPFTGSTGDGYRLAESFGHTIVAPKAALVPVTTVESWPGKLQGVGLENVKVSAKIGSKKVSACGPLMFTSDGLGGPVTLDLSRLITDYLTQTDGPLPITLDMLAAIDAGDLERKLLDGCAQHPNQEIARVLTEFLPRAVSLELVEMLCPHQTILAGRMTKENRKDIISLIKLMPLTIKGLRPLSEATITRGGVSTKEIDSKTMQSKLCPGLFFAGEVIDADGPCGGYNLQIAWSTGALAGSSVQRTAHS